MSLWTDDEFQRSAINTRLSNRTLAACRDVLVNGLSGVEAGTIHQVMPPQISRALKLLREQQAEIIASGKVLIASKEVLKSSVVQEARSVAGEDLVIEDAMPGRLYEGPGIVKKDGFVVQRVGLVGIIHDLGKLQQSPNMNARLSIAYPKDGGLASVNEVVPERSRGGIER